MKVLPGVSKKAPTKKWDCGGFNIMEHTYRCQAHTENHFGEKVTAKRIDVKEDIKGTFQRI